MSAAVSASNAPATTTTTTSAPSESAGDSRPEQPEPEQQPEQQRHPLQFRWTLWYDFPRNHGRVSQKTWEDNLKDFVTVDTVEAFWSVVNNIMEPSQLPVGSNMHMFKEGIRPAWEDAMNEAGGKWVMTLGRRDKARLDEFWINTLVGMVAEHFDAKSSDDLSGVVVSVRKEKARIALWTKTAMREDVRRSIGKTWREAACEGGLPDSFELEYMVHKDAMARDRSYLNKALDRL